MPKRPGTVQRETGKGPGALRRRFALAGALGLLLLLSFTAKGAAQQVITEPESVIRVARGMSALLVSAEDLTRVSVADPDVAEAVVMSPTELTINGRSLGTTTLAVWDTTGGRKLYAVEVTVDAPTLQRYLGLLFPDEDIDVSAQGNTVILSGSVSDAHVARRALELAEGTGAMLIDNLQTPAPRQILLEVRFAEVNRNALDRLGNHVIRTLNPHELDPEGDWRGETDTEGIIDLALINPNADLRVLFRALETTGDFKSLAEPNLLAMNGQEASFLAGGEFPFPTVQGGQASNAVTIEWREFGVRLNFTPTVTNIGNIRLRIAPEVSSLDFAGGLTVAGFQIPTILTRRAETQVELRDGQHLAIAGLLDNTMQESIDKLPVLGDIPILGTLFRSESRRQERRELLVIVTPRVVEPTEASPAVPTGEPETWRWNEHLQEPADSASGNGSGL